VNPLHIYIIHPNTNAKYLKFEKNSELQMSGKRTWDYLGASCNGIDILELASKAAHK
jgi:hypothetical protein